MSQSNNDNDTTTTAILKELEQLLQPLTSSPNPKITNDAEALAAFEQHVGPYPAVVDAAAHHVRAMFCEEMFYHNSPGYDRSFDSYEHPFHRMLKGPKPDLHVWMGLFLGRDREEQSRQVYKDEIERGDAPFSAIDDAFSENGGGEIRSLPMATLTRNVLSYLVTESKKSTRAELLYFCATYGLSHAMNDVLKRNYHDNNKKRGRDDEDEEYLTINSPLRIPNDEEDYRFVRPVGIPALGIAAILGHHHVVRHALKSSRAHWQADVVAYNPDGTKEKLEPVGELALAWVIASKQTEMIQHLVNCGARFCWLSADDFNRLFKLLFHIDGDGDEYGPRWQDVHYNPEEVMYRYASMRDVRRYRAKQCYKEKQKVVMALIKAGMPRELFIPSMDVSIEENLMKEAKEKGLEEPDRAMSKKAEQAMSRAEKKARNHIYGACCAYNWVSKRDKTKTLVEFYQYLLDLWKEQETCQSLFQPWWEQRDDYDYEEEYWEGSSMDVHEMEQQTGLKLVHSEDESEDGLSSSDGSG